VIIPGNHDRAPHSGRRSVLEAFATEGVEVVTRPEVRRAGVLTVACLPSVSRAELAAYGDVLRPEADEAVVDTLRHLVADLATQGTEGADVLTLHTSIAGGILGSEKDLAIIAEPMLRPEDLEGPWRYVAAGHIHRRQVVGENSAPPPAIAYSGSVAPLTFGEEGSHGVFVVELGDKYAAGREVDIPSRPLFSLEWNADLLGENAGVEVPSFEAIEGAIVRVTSVPLDAIDDTRQSLEDEGAWLVKIEPERPDRAVDVYLGEDDLPSTREALETWLLPRVADPDERERIVALAEDL
jgi:DNA repair exonuclease SbcCD nuclease subunit